MGKFKNKNCAEGQKYSWLKFIYKLINMEAKSPATYRLLNFGKNLRFFDIRGIRHIFGLSSLVSTKIDELAKKVNIRVGLGFT